MIISIDTEVLSSVAMLARSINDEITQISEIMKKVVIHEDWNCKERDSINEAIVNNQTAQLHLQELSEDFARSLTSISEQFLDAERTLPNKFQHIDAIIGSAVSIGGGQTNRELSVDTLHTVVSDVVLSDSVKCYEMESLADGLHICDFDTFLQ